MMLVSAMGERCLNCCLSNRLTRDTILNQPYLTSFLSRLLEQWLGFVSSKSLCVISYLKQKSRKIVHERLNATRLLYTR